MRLLLTGILPGILALAVMAGCQALTWLAPAEKHSPLPPEIDRLVMEPVMRSVGVNLSDEQLTLFQTELMEAMNAHEGLSVLEVPPSYLPNTAVMAGVLRHYQFSEQWRGGGFLLRSIVLTLDFIVRPMEGKGELSRGSRTITWQKVYPPEAENPEGAEIPEADEDLKAAVRELGAGLAENQRPVPLPAPIVVDDAREIGSGKAWGVPALLKGNRYARGGVYEQARSLWRVVLFNPEGNEPAGESLYRLTDRSLALLMQHGWSLEQVAVIEPLTRLGPLTLEDYREQLRQLRKGRLEDEGLILAVSEFHRERLHYNAGAAHGNLGMLFALEARYDLATYHLARAYLHNPAGGYLDL
ncbi:MAG: hypothetical protein OEZ59_03540, partial [Deltaproteobacteria bacterium]|nr:hypothetical protein [Deltaproteobacteria bacterium]